MGTGSALGNNPNSGNAGVQPSYGMPTVNQPFQNGAATPMGSLPAMQPRPFVGTQFDTRNVQGAVLPTDAGYQTPFNGTMYDTRNVQGAVLPTDAGYAGPMPSLYGQGQTLPTNSGGTVTQMFGGMPLGTTPARPIAPPAPPPSLGGTGAVLPTNTGGSVTQMFGRTPPVSPMPQPRQPAISLTQQRAMARALRRR